ncbi:MAG TPA: flagellar hook-length control protein FliK [Azospira sp.]|nr:flagellar hook-length control protein FliK [Azospira sp.]
MPSPVISAPAAAPAANPIVGAMAAAGGNAGTSAAASGDGITLIGGDFASLLLSQIAPLTDTAPALPAGTTKDDSAKDDSTGNNDFSALFAALGIPQTPVPVQSSQPPVKDKPETVSTGEQKPLDALSRSGTALQEALQAKENTAPNAGTNTGGESLDQGQDDKAANIATFDKALTKAEVTLDSSQSTAPEAPQGAHAIHAMTHTNTTVATTKAEIQVQTPVRDANWGNEVGQKIVWMANQDKQTAQLTLNPPQLGPLEVSLKINGDQATAVFVSAHAEVREAIEAALPRLREMMGAAGLELGQANVSSQSFQQQSEQARQQQAGSSRGGAEGGILGAAGESAGTVREISRSGNGLVDTFA